jgi:hypothetical protein
MNQMLSKQAQWPNNRPFLLNQVDPRGTASPPHFPNNLPEHEESNFITLQA